MSRFYDKYYYPPTTPKKVKGGIKAQNKNGSFTKNWWGKRWTQTLEGFGIGTRLTRGRNYARQGQVAELNIEKGNITAKVQGSRAKKYNVMIKINIFNKAQWTKIIKKLYDQPLFVAQLLNNEMPTGIEDVFLDAKLNLFPSTQKDLKTNCSCPDYSNPCKHIAAVFYLIGEAFDSDPFLLLKLRGMDKDELLTHLSERSTTDKNNKNSQTLEGTPLSSDIDRFWGITDNTMFQDEFNIPKLNAAIPKRLGNIPFWRSHKKFIDEMEFIYKNSSQLSHELYVDKD